MIHKFYVSVHKSVPKIFSNTPVSDKDFFFFLFLLTPNSKLVSGLPLRANYI